MTMMMTMTMKIVIYWLIDWLN